MLSTLDVVPRLRTISRDQRLPHLTTVKLVDLSTGSSTHSQWTLEAATFTARHSLLKGRAIFTMPVHILYLLAWFSPPELPEQDSSSLRGPLHPTVEVCALLRVTQGDQRGLAGAQQGQLGLWSCYSTSSLFSHPRCRWRKPGEDRQVAESVMGRKGGEKDTRVC